VPPFEVHILRYEQSCISRLVDFKARCVLCDLTTKLIGDGTAAKRTPAGVRV